ncbi:MAG TPA: hypothetical protein VNZ22_09370, partial [Bacillota bacterium]|nr:hypothetical protein [Bacillota bacterium]
SSLVLVTNANATGTDSSYAARVVLEAVGGNNYAISLGGGGGDYNLSVTPPATAGTCARFTGLNPLPDGSCRLVFRTGASSRWKLEYSNDLLNWQRTGFSLLPNGFYDVQDTLGRESPRSFYRLSTDP